jgi:hypothetical protein
MFYILQIGAALVGAFYAIELRLALPDHPGTASPFLMPIAMVGSAIGVTILANIVLWLLSFLPWSKHRRHRRAGGLAVGGQLGKPRERVDARFVAKQRVGELPISPPPQRLADRRED